MIRWLWLCQQKATTCSDCALFSNMTQCYGAEAPTAAKIFLTNSFAFHNVSCFKTVLSTDRRDQILNSAKEKHQGKQYTYGFLMLWPAAFLLVKIFSIL